MAGVFCCWAAAEQYKCPSLMRSQPSAALKKLKRSYFKHLKLVPFSIRGVLRDTRRKGLTIYRRLSPVGDLHGPTIWPFVQSWMACISEANPCCSSLLLNRYQGQGLLGLGQNRYQMRSVHFLANLLRFKPWSRVIYPFVATFFEFVKVWILTITFFSSWRFGIFCNRLINLKKSIF